MKAAGPPPMSAAGHPKLIGIVYGAGELPIAVALGAKAMGFKVVAIALEPVADSSLEPYADEHSSVNVGKLGHIIKALKKSGVSEAVIAGKIPKTVLYEGKVRPDLRAVKVLIGLRDRADDSMINAVSGEFQKDGITLRGITDFCGPLITAEGALTRKGPTRAERKDMEFGRKIAKEVGRLGIGQTVVVKGRAVMAVEAIEGTDEAIRRGGRLAGPGAVVVKVSRPHQDMRFDLPAAGLKTLDVMAEVGVRVLALEAGKSIIIAKDTFIQRAEEAGISVVGVGKLK